MTSLSTLDETTSTSASLDEFGETSGSPRLTAHDHYKDTTIGGEPQTEETRVGSTPSSYLQTKTKGYTDVSAAASHQKRFRTLTKHHLAGTSVTSYRKRMSHVSAQRMVRDESGRRGPDPARAPSPATFSPDVYASEGQLYEEDTRYRQVWFLCATIAATTVIPIGLTFLGYLSYYDGITLNSSTTVLATMTTPYPRRRTTRSSSTFLDQSCLGQLNLNDDINTITGSGATYSSLTTRKSTEFFCLFNNSRFRKNEGFDYLPEMMPFGLCPYVIYWSMSIEDGRVTSRVPDFDRRYGIWELKNISDRLSGNKTKVLMALGGYPEDSPHFARLGNDPVALDSLVADIVACITSYRLDGIAVQWVLPAGACRPDNVTGTLSAFFGNVKRLFKLNDLVALITLILPYGDSASVSSLGSMVDFFFFMTNEYRPPRGTSSLCDDIVTDTVLFINSLPGYSTYMQRICVGISMAAFRFTRSGGNLNEGFSTSTRFPGVRDMAPLYELCGGQVPLHIPGGPCDNYIARLAKSSTLIVFASMSPDSLQEFLYLGFTPRVGGPSCRCALVVDLDFDLYKPGCLNFSLYDRLQRLYRVVQ